MGEKAQEFWICLFSSSFESKVVSYVDTLLQILSGTLYPCIETIFLWRLLSSEMEEGILPPIEFPSLEFHEIKSVGQQWTSLMWALGGMVGRKRQQTEEICVFVDNFGDGLWSLNSSLSRKSI